MATERIVNNQVPQLLNSLHLLVFGSTLFIYNLPAIINGKLVSRFYSPRGILFFAGICFCIASLHGLPASVIVVSALLGVFAIGYSIPILPFIKSKPLRQSGWLKTLDLSFVWTIATYALPVLYWHRSLTEFPVEFLIRFALIFALCLLFDIRDIRLDDEQNLVTLPRQIGVKNCYRLLNAAISLFILFSILQYFHVHLISKLVGAMLTALLLIWVIRYAERYRNRRIYFGLVDGVMLFYAALILI